MATTCFIVRSVTVFYTKSRIKSKRCIRPHSVTCHISLWNTPSYKRMDFVVLDLGERKVAPNDIRIKMSFPIPNVTLPALIFTGFS